MNVFFIIWSGGAFHPFDQEIEQFDIIILGKSSFYPISNEPMIHLVASVAYKLFCPYLDGSIISI